ncbi:ABC transporter ATP-binding protein [Brachybacterium tyrofermentans]|uniref:ABC transporter ATP-binding protein n=1 Tax=Brachybacterium tyrofermentans TaxID=47848 RepID=UPI003F8EF290
MIRYEGIRVNYGDFTAIHDLDLHVREGEFFTLLGPSGCGKTTALRTLAGFVSPSAGDVHVAGRRVTRLPSDKRQIGMVFQNYALFPSLNVRENIAFGLKVRKESRAEVERKVREIAEQVDLSSTQLEKNLADLSGGQQQRVAIARALVLRPKILLLDEPLSNLDAKLRAQLRVQLKDLQEQFGITTVYVTHDQEEALSMSDRIAVFHDGRVEQIGTPEEIYDASATEFVCHFIGDASRLSTALVAEVTSRSGADLDPDRASYVREEKVRLGEVLVPNGFVTVPGTVVRRRYHGVRSSYEISTHGAVVKVMQPEDGSARLQSGDDVHVHIDPSTVLQYDRTDSSIARGSTVRPAPEAVR